MSTKMLVVESRTQQQLTTPQMSTKTKSLLVSCGSSKGERTPLAYSLIAPLVDAHEKSIPQKIERATANLRI